MKHKDSLFCVFVTNDEILRVQTASLQEANCANWHHRRADCGDDMNIDRNNVKCGEKTAKLNSRNTLSHAFANAESTTFCDNGALSTLPQNHNSSITNQQQQSINNNQ
jgi:hypothetical protein